MISAGEFRNGVTLEMDNTVVQIVEFQHVKPGKGSPFVRTKLRDIINGGVMEKTFRPTEKFPPAHVDRIDMQYLYDDGDSYCFMNNDNFEQISLSHDQIGDIMKFVKENEVCKVCLYNGKVFSVEPPQKVILEVVDTEPGVKGDTATGSSKPAKVETGATVMVPLFVNIGDKIIIVTETGKYESRA
ncbi:MAG: elongation factor P [Eubacteriales bacterium]|nr:elongation factor P [Eubacteriales bacterium]